MQGLINFFKTASVILSIISIVGVIFLFMVIGILNRRINRLRKRYDKLLRGRGEINMEELVSMHSKEIENSEIKLSELENDFKLQKDFIKRSIEEIQNQNNLAVSKIGFHRYNAFEYLKGEMSFSLALLDGSENGLIVTSIFGRENSQMYAKEVKNLKAVDELSIEEEIALKMAIDKK